MPKLVLAFLLMIFFVNCDQQKMVNTVSRKISTENGNKTFELRFTFNFDKNIYLNSIYGEPPQLSVWLEDTSGHNIKTIYVTHRAGMNDWNGKVFCEVALPYWESRIKAKHSKDSHYKSGIEAVSSATTKSDILTFDTELDSGSVWNYFIEVNVSGDFNNHFGYYLKSGIPDTEGNGQPSLIYHGKIVIEKDSSSTPLLIGRTFQTTVKDSFSTDLKGITTAKEVIKKIGVLVL